MGKFSGLITVEFHPPKKYVMKKDLSYDCGELTKNDRMALEGVGINLTTNDVGMEDSKLTVRTGFVTDLASVPRILWRVLAPWDVARAAIIHDLLYLTIRQYRWKNHNEDKDLVKRAKKASDKVFLCAMRDAVPAVPGWKRYAAYYAVAMFGRWSIIPNKDNI
jgi:hypothetical protein